MSDELIVPLDELWGDELVPCTVAGDAVFLVRLGDEVRAYRDKCPHQGVPLSEGHLAGCVLTCRAHHHTFDLLSGRGENPPGVGLVRYPVRIADGRVFVSRPSPATEATR